MKDEHPLTKVAVENAATENDCPVDVLHSVLGRFDEITGDRLESLLEHRLDEVGSRAIIDRDEELITLSVDSAQFNVPITQLDWHKYTAAVSDDARGHEEIRSRLQDAITDAHRNHAGTLGVERSGDALVPLTTWSPRIHLLRDGGLSLQEARAHVLRDSGHTQAEIRNRMDLPSKSAAKNTLHRGDSKVRSARRLLKGVNDNDTDDPITPS